MCVLTMKQSGRCQDKRKHSAPTTHDQTEFLSSCPAH